MRLHFHLITRRRLFCSSDDFLRVQTLSIFHFLRCAHTSTEHISSKEIVCVRCESAAFLCVHAESGRPNVSLREYFTQIMATGINIALFVITEMEQRKVAAAGLDVGYAFALCY
jgi:hypothetical protein